MLGKLILFFICVTSVAYCQEYENYTTRDGLPSNHIYHTIQDSKGFMWFATNRGIAKFDGVSFKVFTTKDGLPNNDIWRLTADGQGRVWWNTKSKYLGYIENDSVYKFMAIDGRMLGGQFWRTELDKVFLYEGIDLYLLENNSFKNKTNRNVEKSQAGIEKTLQKLDIPKNFGRNHAYEFFNKKHVFFSRDKLYFYDSSYTYLSDIQLDDTKSRKRLANDINQGMFLSNNSFYVSDVLGIKFINHKEEKGIFYSSKHLFNKGELDAPPLCIAKGNEIQLSAPGYLIILNQEFEIIKKYAFPNFPNNRNSYKDKEGNIWLNNDDKGIVLLPNSINQSNNFLNKKRIQKINKVSNDIIAGVQNEGVYSLNSNQDYFSLHQNLRVTKNIYQIKNNKDLGIISLASSPSYISYSNSIYDFEKLKIKDTGTVLFSKVYTLYNIKDIEVFAKYIYLISGISVLKIDKKKKLLIG